ncbi:MAG TPA: hypothetical protein VGL72_19495 [Bryobacteraceae bacterium]|jgi:hypothetical protein
MRFALIQILGFVSALSLCAQTGTVSGPVEAYTFDPPTRSLRAVIGFPGAASFGPVLENGFDFASIAPHQNFGVGFAGSQCLLIAGLGTLKVSTAAISGVAAQPESVAWSADGSLAVLFSQSGNWLQTISGLPNAPVAGARVDASSIATGLLTAVTVDAKGQIIAIGISGAAGGVFESSDGLNFGSLLALEQPVSLSFSSDSTALYALDGGAPQVFAITLSDRSFASLPLAGLNSPVAIQELNDAQGNQQLYIAAKTDRLVRILDVASQQVVANITLGFQPSGLAQFGSNSFVVGRRAQAATPLWLFATTPQPAAYFVPAVQMVAPHHAAAAIAGGVR